MKDRLTIVLIVLAFVAGTGAAAFAQGATSTISGVVLDTGGGAIPGATVIAKDKAGTTHETVTNTEGVFSIPALSAGTYTVTVSLTGFKTAVVTDVRVVPGTPASVKATLEVGGIEETVTVTSSSELVNTQTATVSSTLNVDQINQMPMPTRNALNAVTFLPGVNTATHQPQLDGQRPARVVPQHHARRRQQQRQLQQVDRRVLRAR